MGVKYPQSSTSDSIKALEDIAIPLRQVVVTPKNGNTEKYSDRKKAIDRLEALKDSNQEISETSIYVEKFAEDQAKSEGCREQRLTYEAKGKKEEADQVFVHEMRARREAKESRFQRFIDWFVADWTCRYGTSWQRVLGVSSGFILFFAFMYWGKKISLIVAAKGFGSVIASHTAEYFGEALHRSIMIFTTLGYTPEYFQDYPLLQTLSAVESIIGALAVALIIVVFARKWMRG